MGTLSPNKNFLHRLEPTIGPRSDLDWCWYLRRHGAAGDTIERALHEIGVMQPGGWADWIGSTMTDTGAPVAMQFTAHQTNLSLLTEVADPQSDPATRVSDVCELMQKFGDTPPPDAQRNVISAMQSSDLLTFGAWLGLKVADNRLETSLHADIPADSADLCALLMSPEIRPVIAALGDLVQPRMISFDARSRDVTLHFDTTSDPHDIVPLLCIPSQVSPVPLLNDITHMLDAGNVYTKSWCELSFSYTFHDDLRPPTLTLFASAKGLFHNDTLIETMVRDYPGDHMRAYTGLADQLVRTTDGTTHHGKIGLQANGDKCPILSIDVAAPWECPVES